MLDTGHVWIEERDSRQLASSELLIGFVPEEVDLVAPKVFVQPVRGVKLCKERCESRGQPETIAKERWRVVG